MPLEQWYEEHPEHPRVCGENLGYPCFPGLLLGTSPRMRGKRSERFGHGRYERNIPAYAGKTSILSVPVYGPTEHPRVCGENAAVNSWEGAPIGTSPRMRGKRRPAHGQCVRPRNIPAYAGKTLIDVRFLVPEGHFTFGFVFLYRGGSVESPAAPSFLSALVTESSFTTGPGPACFRLSAALFGGAVDNFQPFTVNNFPVMVMNSEIVSLLQLAAGERHDCPTRFAFLNDQFPKLIADTRVDLADECSGCHLGEPPGEMAPERFGAGCKHYGNHDASVA